MKIDKLMEIQKGLMDHVEKMHPAQVGENRIKKTILALYVELGELANEVRSFKFWSNKERSPEPVVLEEYVDGVHFILQLAIYLNYDPRELAFPDYTSIDLNEEFLAVYDAISDFVRNGNIELLLSHYLYLGSALGFTWEQIEQGYMLKNNKNHKRQEENY